MCIQSKLRQLQNENAALEAKVDHLSRLITSVRREQLPQLQKRNAQLVERLRYVENKLAHSEATKRLLYRAARGRDGIEQRLARMKY